jgi:atypical dual specificity phosphatase
MDRFYWLVDQALAGSSCPGGTRQGAEAALIERDLAWLGEKDIGAVLTLTENPLPDEVLRGHDLEVLHVPIPDMTAPSPEQFMRALGFIDVQRSRGRAVVVHCLVGQGRTATILAAYLIRQGMPADEAISELRRLCPGAIGSAEQEQALRAFAERADWVM